VRQKKKKPIDLGVGFPIENFSHQLHPDIWGVGVRTTSWKAGRKKKELVHATRKKQVDLWKKPFKGNAEKRVG